MSDETAIAKRPGCALEQAIGGRDRLLDMLEGRGVTDAKQDILVRLLADPARARDSLTSICRDAGVATTEILAMFRDSVMAQALTAAHTRLAERLEGVVTDVADKAVDHVADCQCVALGTVPDPECEICKGSGRVFYRGSLDHAKVVLGATGLHGSGGKGVNVNVNQQVAVAGGGGALLDRFVKATDDAAFDVIDAEKVVSSPDPEGA